MIDASVHIVMYHYVRDLKTSSYPEIKGLDRPLFDQQLQFLKQHFTIISPHELVEAIQHGGALPQNSALLTFDDGYIDHYTDVYPCLKEQGMTGLFSMPGKILAEQKVLDVNKVHFILASQGADVILPILMERLNDYRGKGFAYPSNEELFATYAAANRFDPREVIFIKRILQVVLPEELRNMITDELFRHFVTEDEAAFCQNLYLNMEQIQEMKQGGMVFGYHGYDHYWMNHLSEQALEQDIAAAMQVFQGIIDPKSWICCYPYGSYSDGAIEICKKHGAAIGLGTDVGICHLERVDPFKIPRLDTNDFPPKSTRYLEYL